MKNNKLKIIELKLRALEIKPKILWNTNVAEKRKEILKELEELS